MDNIISETAEMPRLFPVSSGNSIHPGEDRIFIPELKGLPPQHVVLRRQ
jgi:hypothetical protein